METYLGNPNLQKANVTQEWTKEEVSEYTKCMKDPQYFIDPRVRASMFVIFGEEKNKYCNIAAVDKCESGQALFFPSWLEHAVSQNLTDNPRISISCNFIVTGN